MKNRPSRWVLMATVATVATVMALGPLGAAGSEGGLGVGRGVDHVAALVRPENFATAVAGYGALGFATTPPLLSPLGAKNSLIWFADLSYLEVATFTELNPFTAPFLDFLANHEGGKFYGSEVTDFTTASTFLTAAGYPNVAPIPAPPLTIEPTGELVGLTPLWYSVVLTSVVAPDNSTFFLDYDEAQVQAMFTAFPSLAPRPHPNTAQRIETLWLVVADLDAAISFYEGLGLPIGARNQKVHYLGGRGAEVRFRHQTLRLLEPDGPGLVADFAADRGEGVLGVSLKVGRLATAEHWIETHTGEAIHPFQYKGRQRFLIPTELTRGLLVEMVE